MSLKKTEHGYRHNKLPVIVYREAEPNYPWAVVFDSLASPAVYARTLDQARSFLDAIAKVTVPVRMPGQGAE